MWEDSHKGLVDKEIDMDGWIMDIDGGIHIFTSLFVSTERVTKTTYFIAFIKGTKTQRYL